ncbi:MAG: hypothetical protein WC455_17610 [Dehalococcoidia bacterium]|jgi:hypothetical protein
MAVQVKLDWSNPRSPVEDEKKLNLIAFRVGDKFKSDLEMVCGAKGVGMSELLHEYAIKGFLDDYKTILLIQSKGRTELRDLLKRS